MANYLSKAVSSAKKVGKHVVAHHIVETATYAGASYGFGYVQARWREHAHIAGVPMALAAGMASKVVAIGMEMSGHSGRASEALSTIGNAGIGAFMVTLGSAHGSKAGGDAHVIVDQSQVGKVKKTIAGAVVVGDLGPAPTPGNFLSSQQLAAMAR